MELIHLQPFSSQRSYDSPYVVMEAIKGLEKKTQTCQRDSKLYERPNLQFKCILYKKKHFGSATQKGLDDHGRPLRKVVGKFSSW